MNIEAKLIKKEAVQKGTSASGNNWQKQNLIFEIEGQYPKKICVGFWNKSVDEIVSELLENHNYNVYIDIESRECNGNWYTEAKAWKVEPLGASARPNNQPKQEVNDNAEEGSDLPF